MGKISYISKWEKVNHGQNQLKERLTKFTAL